MTAISKYCFINFISFYFVLFVEVTVTERDRVTERVIVALLLGDLVRLSVTLGVLVNGRVVGIAERLTVREPDLVNGRVVGIAERLTVREPDRVANIDAGTV